MGLQSGLGQPPLSAPDQRIAAALVADPEITSDISLPIIPTDMMSEDIWGLSPSGTAAMNDFWFHDMMWDVPAADTDLFGNTGTGFVYSELDWLSGLDPASEGGQQ